MGYKLPSNVSIKNNANKQTNLKYQCDDLGFSTMSIIFSDTVGYRSPSKILFLNDWFNLEELDTENISNNFRYITHFLQTQGIIAPAVVKIEVVNC